MRPLDFIPQHYLQALARAADRGELCMVVLLEEEQIERLQRGQSTLLDLDVGGALLLVPTETVRAARDAADAAGDNGGLEA